MKIIKFIAIVLLVAMTIAAVSCSKSDPASQSSGISAVQGSGLSGGSGTSDASHSSDHILIDIPVEKMSSIQKISEALADNRIDKKTAVLLAIQSVHQISGLPVEYANDEGCFFPENLMAEYQWIQSHFSTLTEEEKISLEPFLLPPDNEQSFFHPKNKDKPFSLFRFLFGAQEVAAAANEWKEIQVSVPGRPIAAIIHYYMDSSDPNAAQNIYEQEAKLVEAAFKDSWVKFKELLGSEPSQTINVYIGISSLGPGVYGLTQPATSTVLLAPLLDDKTLKSTMVHELFHCFQIGMGLGQGDVTDEMLWLLDSTATWSENWIYPDYNREHEYLPFFFKDLDNPLVAKYNRYSSYMFFYFLQDYLQDTSAVSNSLKMAKTTPVLDILPSLVADYNTAFYLYAGYNYNSDPLKFYKDKPSFPAFKADENLTFIDSASSYDVRVLLEHGSMRYDMIDFTEDINKIVDIEFTFAALEDKQYARRALVKIAGEWHEEDWSGISKRKFCRNEPSENVEAVLLIHSVSNLKSVLDYTYFINTSQACDNPFKGSIHITASMAGPDGMNSSTEYSTRLDIRFDEDENCYIVKERQIDYMETGGIATRFIVGPASDEIDVGAFNSSFLSTGHLYEEYASEVFRAITGNKEDGYHIIINPDTRHDRWVTTYSRTLLIGTSTFLIDKSDGVHLYFSDFDVRPDEITGKRLKGTRTMDVNGAYGSGSATLEFDFQLP